MVLEGERESKKEKREDEEQRSPSDLDPLLKNPKKKTKKKRTTPVRRGAGPDPQDGSLEALGRQGRAHGRAADREARGVIEMEEE